METTNETGTPPSDSGNARKSLVEQFARPRYDPPTKKVAPVESEPVDDSDAPTDGSYRGLVKYRARKSPRFRIVDRNGVSYGCGYAYLLFWKFLPPDTLTIQTTTYLFTLSGTNLKLVEDALLREMVLELREHNPEQDAPPEPGQPLIDHLEAEPRF